MSTSSVNLLNNLISHKPCYKLLYCNIVYHIRRHNVNIPSEVKTMADCLKIDGIWRPIDASIIDDPKAMYKELKFVYFVTSLFLLIGRCCSKVKRSMVLLEHTHGRSFNGQNIYSGIYPRTLISVSVYLFRTIFTSSHIPSE